MIKNKLCIQKSDNVTIMHGYATNDIIDELFITFNERYQGGLETKMVGSNYTFDHIDYLDYHFNKATLTRASSFVPLPEILSKKNVLLIQKIQIIMHVLNMQ